MADYKESLNSTGLQYAAKNPNYNTSFCFNLSAYNYAKNSSTPCDNNSYLEGVTGAQNNALGMSVSYTYWGRSIEVDSGKMVIKKDSAKYISGFGKIQTKKKLLPLVYKNYGLIPIPSESGADYPFKVKKVFSRTTYLKYDAATDECKYSQDQSSWTTLNAGPGVYFIMCGGGGGGGHASTTFAFFGTEGAGGGGGGGASVVGFMDLRKIDKIVEFECGAAGQAEPNPPRTGGSSGLNGGSSVLKIKQNNGYLTLLSCQGGSGGIGGKGTSSGGSGGIVNHYTNYYTEAKSIKLLDFYYGKPGGKGGGKTSGNNGVSFDNTVKIAMPILKNENLPSENNGVYGIGTDCYKYDDASHYGGGGGASIVSRHDGASALGYGTGGAGGPYKNNVWWGYGCNGQPGVLLILEVE